MPNNNLVEIIDYLMNDKNFYGGQEPKKENLRKDFDRSISLWKKIGFDKCAKQNEETLEFDEKEFNGDLFAEKLVEVADKYFERKIEKMKENNERINFFDLEKTFKNTFEEVSRKLQYDDAIYHYTGRDTHDITCEDGKLLSKISKKNIKEPLNKLRVNKLDKYLNDETLVRTNTLCKENIFLGDTKEILNNRISDLEKRFHNFFYHLFHGTLEQYRRERKIIKTLKTERDFLLSTRTQLENSDPQSKQKEFNLDDRNQEKEFLEKLEADIENRTVTEEQYLKPSEERAKELEKEVAEDNRKALNNNNPNL